MLTAEQTRVVRSQIATVLNVDNDSVVPAARFFGDLGATGEHLKPLRQAIEAAMSVQIEPIVNQVNARTAVDQYGLLTDESQSQIVDYLGEWPGLPTTKVSFPDLFTVGMIEAIVAKAISGVPAVEDDQPLQLSPALTKQVHQAIAEVYKLPIDQVHSDLDLSSLADDGEFDFAQAMIEIKSALGINFDGEMDLLKRSFGELSQGTATAFTMQKLRRFVPNLDTASEDGLGQISTVGIIERLCAAAIARRESPETARTYSTPRQSLGLYLSNWSWSDQDWWASLPGTLGAERFRLYLAGMLRAAFMESASMDGDANDILETAEKFAETASNPATIERKFRSLSNRRKFWRTRYWGGLLSVLNPECTPEAGGGVLAAIEDAFHWKQPQVIAAARQWQQSMISPLKEPTEFAAEWCTPEVRELAKLMHDNRAFLEFPKLGNLLEQAGCDAAVFLDHCRDPARRHLLGDWLIDAILTTAPAAASAVSRGKSGGRTAKPKKPKLPVMSYGQKKRFKELLVKERGGLPLATAWAAVWTSDHTADQEHFQKMNPHLPAEALTALGGMYPALRTVWPDVAVARRLHLQSVADLQTALVLHARISLLTWHTSPSLYELANHFRNAFAARDEASLCWAFNELPSPPRLETDFAHWAYLVFRAIYARDEPRMRMLIDRWPHPENSKNVPAVEMALLAILSGVPERVVTALNDMLDEQRKSEEPDGFGAFSLNVIACYQAAYWRNPALVSDFDVTQTAPWDADFDAHYMATSQPLEAFDFSTTPYELRDLLLTQAIPQWLRDLQRCPQNTGDRVGLILTDVGPNPDAVYRQIQAHFGNCTRAEFHHRTSKLPVTVTSEMSRLTCESYRDALQRAGATVETVR